MLPNEGHSTDCPRAQHKRLLRTVGHMVSCAAHTDTRPSDADSMAELIADKYRCYPAEPTRNGAAT